MKTRNAGRHQPRGRAGRVRLEYAEAIALLKGMGFRETFREVCRGSRYARDAEGEFTILTDDRVNALLVNPAGDYYGNDCVMLECVSCFDKWSRCPVVLRFPAREDVLTEAVEFLRTPRGRRYSERLEYLDEPLFPREERHPHDGGLKA